MHSWIDAGDVDIQVRGGEVTLAGTVEDRASKRAIEDLADDVLGVKDVQNNIRLRARGQDGDRAPSVNKPKA
jgi:osmotically-inducible protein OsmY